AAPGEEGQERAGPTRAVPVVEVIGLRVVEVDGRLHQPQAEAAQIDVDIALRLPTDRRDVVQAAGREAHDLAPPNSMGADVSQKHLARKTALRESFTREMHPGEMYPGENLLREASCTLPV